MFTFSSILSVATLDKPRSDKYWCTCCTLQSIESGISSFCSNVVFGRRILKDSLKSSESKLELSKSASDKDERSDEALMFAKQIIKVERLLVMK